MKTIYSLLALLFISVSCNNLEINEIQVGDVVFIEGGSQQAPYIKLGTMSRWTHCGVIVDTPDGLQVLEASKTVRLTPVEKFIGWAVGGNWCIKRPTHTLQRPVKYHKYLCQPYDLEFQFDNGKMYCSELVWLIYKEQGIELCKPRPVSSFLMTRLPKVSGYMSRRNISKEQMVVAPVDLYNAM